MGVDSFKRVPPHPRGWSRCGSRPEPGCRGSPAPAGMVPGPLAPTSRYRRFPRTRGDGPYFSHGRWTNAPVPPHPRGWSRRGAVRHARLCGSPAPAGMVPRWKAVGAATAGFPRTRGDGPHSHPTPADAPSVPPHPRGWSPIRRVRPRLALGSPAPAGMVPQDTGTRRRRPRFPRTRGDGPCADYFIIGIGRVPPHPRGWSLSM